MLQEKFLFIGHGAVVSASVSEADGLWSARIELFIMMIIVVAGSNPGADLVGFKSRRRFESLSRSSHI